jgi:hypothetical protein
MEPKPVLWIMLAVALAISSTACTRRPEAYAGPGCLIYLYPRSTWEGLPLPVRGDVPELAAAWNDKAASAKVVYGTWRLYANPDFNGFMGDYKAPADIAQFTPVEKIGSLRCVLPEPTLVVNY